MHRQKMFEGLFDCLKEQKKNEKLTKEVRFLKNLVRTTELEKRAILELICEKCASGISMKHVIDKMNELREKRDAKYTD